MINGNILINYFIIFYHILSIFGKDKAKISFKLGVIKQHSLSQHWAKIGQKLPIDEFNIKFKVVAWAGKWGKYVKCGSLLPCSGIPTAWNLLNSLNHF